MIFIKLLCLYLFSIGVICERNGTMVKIFFNCFENPDYETMDKGMPCELKLKLSTSVDNKFTIGNYWHMKEYDIKKGVSGMCKRGLYDSRLHLKEPLIFNTLWRELVVYIEVIKGKEGLLPFVVYNAAVTPLFGGKTYETKLMRNEAPASIKIELNITFSCAQNFHGPKCETYCVDVKDHFQCYENGSRKCINDYYGTDCNKIKKCPQSVRCTCTNIINTTMECIQESIQCNKQIPGCGESQCELDLIDLTIKCPNIVKGNGTSSGMNMLITMPAGVLGAIIVVLLLIILIQGLYKGRKMKKMVKNRRKTARPLPKRPEIISYTDDYQPPYSHYMDMRTMCPSECPYNNSTLNGSQSDEYSTCSPSLQYVR